MFQIILENFKFLVSEVENQVRSTQILLAEFDTRLIEKIEARDDYIDNLKTVLENTCFSRIHDEGEAISTHELHAVRAAHVMSVNLEKIGDFCVNIARQTDYLTHYEFLHQYPYEKMFDLILEALSKITETFQKHMMKSALEICQAEHHLDILYKEIFDSIMTDLKQGREVGNYVTTIFIMRYLERIGDSLLNIGEALLFAITGDRIKIRQFKALQSTLAKSGVKLEPEHIEFSSIWGSRSGCRISRVNNANPAHMQVPIIFKEGAIQKIQKEKQNIERWAAMFPEVTPLVIGYEENTTKAAMLLEFMDGQTLEEMVLSAPEEDVEQAFAKLEALLERTWNETIGQGPSSSDFMQQLEKRLVGVHRIHPEFQRPQLKVGHVTVPSPLDLVKVCGRVEATLKAPFKVWLHGDFNLNNILFDASKDQIKYIDFYRSGYADYVQDAAVFLISHFRLPITSGLVRHRLNRNIKRFYAFFKSFARSHKDELFQIRMALALARSFYTSTRFEMNPYFAGDMYRRAIFLLESISQHKGRPWEAYQFSEAILYY